MENEKVKRISSNFCKLLLVICSITTSLFGEIIETDEIKTLIPFVNQDSFVFLNVTGTLYAPSNILSSHEWREYFSDRVKEIMSDGEEAEQWIDKIKNQIVTQIPKKKIEDLTPRLIAHLQDKGVTVLGLTQKRMATSYADNFGEITGNHLFSLGIQLERTLEYLKIPKERLEQHDFSFAYGILFTNKQPVGPALAAFIELSGQSPSNVVMIDNSLNSLEDAQEALKSTGIKFTGIRYGRADKREEFDPTLGIIEFFAFMNEGVILSDDEALKTMPIDKSVDYEAMLDEYIQEAFKPVDNQTNYIGFSKNSILNYLSTVPILKLLNLNQGK